MLCARLLSGALVAELLCAGSQPVDVPHRRSGQSRLAAHSYCQTPELCRQVPLTVPLGAEDSNSLVVSALLLIQKLMELAPAKGW